MSLRAQSPDNTDNHANSISDHARRARLSAFKQATEYILYIAKDRKTAFCIWLMGADQRAAGVRR